MTLATVGWGVWWITVLLMRFAPGIAPSPTVTAWVASSFAVVGLFLAIFTIRARTIWVLLAGVPIFANGSLLALPFVVQDLEVHAKTGTDDADAPSDTEQPLDDSGASEQE